MMDTILYIDEARKKKMKASDDIWLRYHVRSNKRDFLRGETTPNENGDIKHSTKALRLKGRDICP